MARGSQAAFTIQTGSSPMQPCSGRILEISCWLTDRKQQLKLKRRRPAVHAPKILMTVPAGGRASVFLPIRMALFQCPADASPPHPAPHERHVHVPCRQDRLRTLAGRAYSCYGRQWRSVTH
jgi:hypothetical protein